MIGVLPSNQPLPEEELIAWRMSVMYNREKHPLIKENKKRHRNTMKKMKKNDTGMVPTTSNRTTTTVQNRKKNGDKGDEVESMTGNDDDSSSSSHPTLVTLPEPDTVHISILENTGAGAAASG